MRTLAAIAVLLLVAACQAPPVEMTEAEMAQIQAEVIEVMEGFLEGSNQLNADMMMTAYHPTETAFAWGSTPRDFAEVNERWENWVEGTPAWESQWTETTVKVLSQNAAMFQGMYEATRTGQSGTVYFYPGHSMTLLLERTAEGWKITMGDWSAGPREVVSEGEG